MTPNPPDASPPIQEENTAFEISLLMNSLQPFCRYFPFASTTPHVVVILLAHDVQDLRRTVIRQGLISPPFHLGPLFDKENWEDVTLVVMYTWLDPTPKLVSLKNAVFLGICNLGNYENEYKIVGYRTSPIFPTTRINSTPLKSKMEMVKTDWSFFLSKSFGVRSIPWKTRWPCEFRMSKNLANPLLPVEKSC